MVTMQQDFKSSVTANAKEYTVSTREALSGTSPNVALSARVQGDGRTAIFFALVDPFYMSVHATSNPKHTTIQRAHEELCAAIRRYIENSDIENGVVYYGHMLQNGKFEITGTEKPDWDDNSWGALLVG